MCLLFHVNIYVLNESRVPLSITCFLYVHEIPLLFIKKVSIAIIILGIYIYIFSIFSLCLLLSAIRIRYCASKWKRDCRGRARMVVIFTTTYAISAYHHYRCELESRSWRGVLDTTLCDKDCQWFAAGRWRAEYIYIYMYQCSH